MTPMILPFGPDAIAEAAARVVAGEPVAVATETVYGIAADARNGAAVARVYQAKGRPAFNPLIVHASSASAAEAIGRFDATARRLAEAFWPGPLTLVVPLRENSGIAPLVTAGLPTVALRVPAHRAIRALLEASGAPLAAPSANASGRISPTMAVHVAASLGGGVALVIDDGPTAVGIESTIVAPAKGGLRLLRAGPIGAEELEKVAGVPVLAGTGEAIEAPGQLASHYAPSKPLRLDATDARAGEWLIGFGPVGGDESLSPAGDLVEAAANLFAALHRAEASDAARIAVAPVPERGIGAAVNDRLRRAAV